MTTNLELGFANVVLTMGGGPLRGVGQVAVQTDDRRSRVGFVSSEGEGEVDELRMSLCKALLSSSSWLESCE